MKDSLPCMFNLQTYGPKPGSPAHLAQADYVQWSFWHRHSATFITLAAAPTAGTLAIVAADEYSWERR